MGRKGKKGRRFVVDFSEILQESSSVFKDKGVLSPHYVPETLLYRDDELRKIMLCLAPALKGQKAKNLFVYGKSGTGKPASPNTFSKSFCSRKTRRLSGCT